ncbi:LOW QUALITY PROTEIN: hypothetical protein Ct61P_03130 [Colletotrichum tofieldiae]|nr:LOW QUALITY PROTEIN: hypothetical protein Ct61P_03130 [Colletotrichum tofieldiae]
MGRTYLWELKPVGHAVLGEDDHLAAGAAGGDRLLAQAADAEDLAGERELARHGNGGVDGGVEGEREERGGHGDAGRGAVLGHGAVWHVQVQLGLVEEVVVGEVLDHERLGERVGNGRRLLHDVLEVARDLEAGPAAGPQGRLQDRLDVHGGAAHLGPGETHGDTGGVDLVEAVRGEDRGADVVDEVVLADGDVDRVGDVEGDAGLLGGRGLGGLLARLARRLGLLLRLGQRLLAILRQGLLLGEDLLAEILHDLERRLSVHLFDLLLEVAHAGLAGVRLDELLDGLLAELHVGVGQTRGLSGGRGKVFVGDGLLLVGDVAGELDQLHAVEKGSRDGVRHVGGADEEDLGQVDGDVHVVVQERAVLLGIKKLEQGRRGVALVAAANLVDLVDEDQWVLRLALLQRLDDATGQSADVGSSVTLDLSHVRQTTDAESVVLAVQGAGNGLADGRLSDTRGPTKQMILPSTLSNRNKLENPVLDVLQSVVILIQDRHGVLDAKVLGAALTPGDLRQPVEVVPCDVKLGCCGFKVRKLVDLVIKHLAHGFGHRQLVRLLLEPLNQLVLAVGLQTQFAADALHLLHQPVLALALSNLTLDVLGDLGLELGVHELLLQDDKGLLHSLLDVETRQDFLEFALLTRGDSRGEICQLRRLGGDVTRGLAHGERRDLVAEEAVHRSNLLEHVDDLVGDGADDGALGVVGLLGQVLDVDETDGVSLKERCGLVLLRRLVGLGGHGALLEARDDVALLLLLHLLVGGLRGIGSGTGSTLASLDLASSFPGGSRLDRRMRRVQDGRQGALLAVHGEGARDLRKDTGIVDVIDVADNVLVLVLVLEQEGTDIRLASLDHLGDGGGDVGVLDGDGLVEAGEQRSLRNGDGQDLGVDIGHDGLLQALVRCSAPAPAAAVALVVSASGSRR